MFKKVTFVLILIGSNLCIMSQGLSANKTMPNNSKPIIDIEAINTWLTLGDNRYLRITANGQHFSYSVKQSNTSHYSTIVQSIDSKWKREYKAGSEGFFSANNKRYVLQVGNDLCFVTLGAGEIWVKDVSDFQAQEATNPKWVAYRLRGQPTIILKDINNEVEKRFENVEAFSFNKSKRWFSYRNKDPQNELVLVDLTNNLQKKYRDVIDYVISDDGKRLALQTKDKLEWVDIDGARKTLWSVSKPNHGIAFMTFDKASAQLLFMVKESGKGEATNSIWYYKPGMSSAVLKADNNTKGADGLNIVVGSFSKNGDFILLQLEENLVVGKPDQEKVKLDVWTYWDTVIQSVQLYQKNPKSYAAVVGVDEHDVIRLQYDYETIRRRGSNFIVIAKNVTGDRFWESEHDQDSIWLVRFEDGKRVFLPHAMGVGANPHVSPDEQYLVYFDPSNRFNYFSYNIATGRFVNISSSVPQNIFVRTSAFDPTLKRNPGDVQVAGWLKDGSILVHDNNDIWQLDLENNSAPLNLTNGFGRKNNLSLWISYDEENGFVDTRSGLLLMAYDLSTMENGFYRKQWGKSGDPQRLYMGPYSFYLDGPSSAIGKNSNFDLGMLPTKAANSDVWIVKRQSAIESPNYFITSDFRSFRRLTDIQPQRKYNWLSSELLRFLQSDGTMGQGVLHKPENFDSTKKYPVIINYYRIFSQRLHQFPEMNFMHAANLDKILAWFVSRGYLVFTPDIYQIKESAGESCFNTVDGAASYLSSLPYIDSARMAICGHSLGGSLTMYMLTHSHRFAAVFAGAIPATDKISRALGRPTPNNDGEYSWLEQSEGTVGASIWERPELWLKDNPVMLADKITMPLLIYHGELDRIPLSQPLELFFAMRRLNKPVWLLNYNTAGHTTRSRINAEDLTIRATQYFDHYLMNKPAPLWMTKGIPAKLKQIESRYEFDTVGICGAANCQTCNKNKATKQSKDNTMRYYYFSTHNQYK